MTKMKIAVAVVMAMLLFGAAGGDRWPDSSGGGSANISAEFYGQNMTQAEFTGGEVLTHVNTLGPVVYASTGEHLTGSPATGAAGEVAVPESFLCFFGNDTGTGTANFTLAVYEDGNDTTGETIATISFNMATEMEMIKQTTTFSAISSTAPYFFAVVLADGGSVAPTGATSDAVCRVVWSVE